MMLKGKVGGGHGAGRGIGREIARLMARHGAQVVVNDYGGSAAGSGGRARPADEVVTEIAKAGGKAVANYDRSPRWPAARRSSRRRVDTLRASRHHRQQRRDPSRTA